jgi:hypothetical protein
MIGERMTKVMVNMFGSHGGKMNHEPFLVDMIELRKGKNGDERDNYIILEEGDRFEVVKVKK